MKCAKCGAEIKDGEKKCPECGEKRPGYFNFIKRRQLREQETAEILEKSYIHEEDVAAAGVSGLSVRYRGKVGEELVRSGIKLGISVLFMCACIAVIAIRQYTALLDGLDTLGTAIVLLGAFLLLFGNGASVANSSYFIARLNALKKQGLGVSKINYGKNPTAVYAGNVYEVSVSDTCPKCEQSTAMHIEQVQDMLVAVCNADRNHLFRLDKAFVLNAIMESEFKRTGLPYTPIVLESAKAEEGESESRESEREEASGKSAAEKTENTAQDPAPAESKGEKGEKN